MGKASIGRLRGVEARSIALPGWLALGAFAACSGGNEFTSADPPHDPDASMVTGSGGTSSGGKGSGGKGSGGETSSGGASATVTDGGGGAPGEGARVDASNDDAGDGGPLPPECVQDDDCAAFACDTASRCEAGACTLGSCVAADAGNCTELCVRGISGATCAVIGKDADRDGHRDALCTENPGDDCDDTRASVHVGAAEVCDGLDNDCDGASDVFDGLPLGGTPKLLRTIDAPKSARLGLLARSGGYALLTADLEYSFAQQGVPSELRLLGPNAAVLVTTAFPPNTWLNDPAMAVNGSGIVVLTRSQSAIGVSLAGVIGGAIPLGTIVSRSLPMGHSMCSGPNDTMAGVWAEHPETATDPELSVIAGRVLDASGNPGALTKIASVGNPGDRAGRTHIASRGAAGFAIAWVESQFSTAQSGTVMDQVIHLTLTNASLSPVADYKLDLFRELTEVLFEYDQGDTTRPQVVVDGNAFVVGYQATPGTMAFVRVRADGTKLCKTTPLPGVSSWAAAHSMLATPAGVLFAATHPSGDTVLYRVSQPSGALNQDCVIQRVGFLNAPGADIAVKDQTTTLGDTVMALGADGRLAFTWVERDAAAVETEPSRVVARLLGPKLCD